jgi:hypothetical protein
MKTKKTKRKSSSLPVRHAKKIIRITPKFLHGVVVGALVGVVVVMALKVTNSAYATTTPTCTVTPVRLPGGLGPNGSFSISGNTATTTFIVTGPAGCTADVTMATWRAPYGTNSFLPYDQQKLLYSKTTTVTAGHQYDMTIQTAPNCNYQIDTLRGSKATAADGTANYTSAEVVSYVQVKTQICEPTTSPTKPPATTPTTTPTTTPAATTPTTTTPQSAPTTLANTGPGAVVIIFILAVIGGFVFHMTHRHVKHKRRTARHHA